MVCCRCTVYHRPRSRRCWSATPPPCAAGSAGSTARAGRAGRSGGSPRCWAGRARGRCRGSGSTWAGRRSAHGHCTGGSGWRRYGCGPSGPPRGDPHHDHVVAGIVARLIALAPPVGGAGRGQDPPEPAAARAGHLDAARQALGGPHPGREPQGHRARGARGEHRGVGVPAGPPLRGGLHRPAGSAARCVPAGSGDRGDLRQRQHPSRPQGHRPPGEASPSGVAVRRPVQSARQSRGEPVPRQQARHRAAAPPVRIPQVNTAWM